MSPLAEMLHSAMQHDTEGKGWLLQAYEALAINEFHNAPVDFLFTSPLNATVLPTLRVSGEPVQEPKCTCRHCNGSKCVALSGSPAIGFIQEVLALQGLLQLEVWCVACR